MRKLILILIGLLVLFFLSARKEVPEKVVFETMEAWFI